LLPSYPDKESSRTDEGEKERSTKRKGDDFPDRGALTTASTGKGGRSTPKKKGRECNCLLLRKKSICHLLKKEREKRQ